MRTRIVLQAGLTLAIVLLSAWTVSAQSPTTAPAVSPAAVPPVTVRMPLTATTNLDPSAMSLGGTPDEFIARQMFAGLTRADTGGDAVPDLAESWSSSPDCSVFTFTLRSGLLWSDATTITADDVRYSITRSISLDPNSDYTYVIRGMVAGADNYTNTQTLGIRPVNATTVVFTLTKSASYFPSVLAVQLAALVQRQAIFDHGAAWTDPGNIVVSGAYLLTESTPGVRKVLTRNANYWDAANVQIERVELPQLSDSLAWADYTLGLLDTMPVPASSWKTAVNDPLLGPELHTAPFRITQFVGIGTGVAPFTSTLVRQAFSAAIDRQTLADVVLSGTMGAPYLPAGPWMPPGIWGHDQAVSAGVGWPYSPTLARACWHKRGTPTASACRRSPCGSKAALRTTTRATPSAPVGTTTWA